MLKTYSERSLEQFEQLSGKEIEKDNMTHFQTEDQEK